MASTNTLLTSAMDQCSIEPCAAAGGLDLYTDHLFVLAEDFDE